MRNRARNWPLGVLMAGVVGLAGCASGGDRTGNARLACVGEFDFWLGNWDVRQRLLNADGSWLELPASTSVTREGGGCAIIEHWSGSVQFFWEDMQAPEEIWGLSVRVRDPQSGLWSIYWMDSRSPRFDAPYVVGFQGNRGEFFRAIETPGGPRLARIVFSRARPELVNWELAVSADQGASWTPLWTMEMQRRSVVRQ